MSRYINISKKHIDARYKIHPRSFITSTASSTFGTRASDKISFGTKGDSEK